MSKDKKGRPTKASEKEKAVLAKIAKATTDDEALEIAIADAEAARVAIATTSVAGAGELGKKDSPPHDKLTSPAADSKPTRYMHVLKMNRDGTTTPIATDFPLPDAKASTEERFTHLVAQYFNLLATDSSPAPASDGHLAKLLASRAATKKTPTASGETLALGPHTKAILDEKTAAHEETPGRK